MRARIGCLTFALLGACLAACTRSPALPPATSGPVVGFGDSIAAGWGLGRSDGYPNNPAAYSSLVAAALNRPAYNFSIGGACAAAYGEPGADPNTPPACKHSVYRDELPAARRMVPSPSVVTMTIGANDIRFAECALHLVSPLPLPFSPCEDPLFSRLLGALTRNLSRVLAAARSAFPSARIVITSLYDPLAPRPSLGTAVCPLSEAGAAVDNPLTLLSPILLRRAAVSFQGRLHDRAESVIARADAAIEAAARANGATFDRLDFAGHDMCRAQEGGTPADAWVYGPSIHVALAGALLRGAPRRWDLVLPSACIDPASDPPPIRSSVSLLGGRITLTSEIGSNCMPHPTAQGQAAIARSIVAALGGNGS